MDLSSLDSLTLSGGGYKGFSYIGVFRALEEKLNISHLKYHFKNISCTSIGAIFGLLLIAGYSSKELELLLKINGKIDLVYSNINLSLLFEKFGISDGSRIIDYLGDLLEAKGFKRNITLKTFYKKTKIKFIICSANINQIKPIYFEYISNPELEVLMAIRMSIGVPFLFTSFIYENQYYIDGAIFDNVPVKFFNPKTTLIIKLNSKENNDHITYHSLYNNFDEYFFQILKCFTKSLTISNVSEEYKNIIYINTNVQFFITSNEDNEIKNLINMGYENTIRQII
jgi:NTE family protein